MDPRETLALAITGHFNSVLYCGVGVLFRKPCNAPVGQRQLELKKRKQMLQCALVQHAKYYNAHYATCNIYAMRTAQYVHFATLQHSSGLSLTFHTSRSILGGVQPKAHTAPICTLQKSTFSATSSVHCSVLSPRLVTAKLCSSTALY